MLVCNHDRDQDGPIINKWEIGKKATKSSNGLTQTKLSYGIGLENYFTSSRGHTFIASGLRSARSMQKFFGAFGLNNYDI